MSDEAVVAYQELKLKKKFKYAIFKISDNKTTINLEKTGNECTYTDFVAAFPKNECRYAVYDFDYVTTDGARNKLLFYVWYLAAD